MSEEEIKKSGHHPADTNGDGKVSRKEQEMYLEFKRKELEDADAMRDAQRKMAWFALGGMLLYPFAVVIAVLGRGFLNCLNKTKHSTLLDTQGL